MINNEIKFVEIVSEMPGATPIQGQGPVNSSNSSNSDIDCVEKVDSEVGTNSKKSSLSSTCSSMNLSSPSENKVRWSPIRREGSHCDSEPSTTSSTFQCGCESL